MTRTEYCGPNRQGERCGQADGLDGVEMLLQIAEDWSRQTGDNFRSAGQPWHVDAGSLVVIYNEGKSDAATSSGTRTAQN